MAIEHKDVMMAVASAAGGATALGIGFVLLGAGLLSVTGTRATAPKWLARSGVVAFLCAMVSAFLASGWILIASWRADAGVLEVVYAASLILFVASMVIFLVVFFWAAVLLWTSDLANVARTFLEGRGR